MKPKSLYDIRTAFNITASSPEEIRRELRRRLKSIHPDAHAGGDTPERGNHEDTLRITEALALVDELRSSTAVVPVEAVSGIVQAMQKTGPNGRRRELDDKLSAKIKAREHAAKQGTKPLTIVLIALGSVVLASILFPGAVSSSPVLERMLSGGNPAALLVLLALLLLTAGLFGIYRLWCSREISSKQRLQLESEQNRLFFDFIRSPALFRRDDSQAGFYKDQFVVYLQNTGPRHSLVSSILLGRPRPIDPDLAETLAETMLLRAEEKGLLRKSTAPSLREHYVLSKPPEDL